jgi:formylglycine-generating enzyme required for sulfatase activity
MSAHPQALPSSYHIQEYELVRELGSGGFAITYLAFDNNMDRGCAIKEYLPRGLATRESGETVVANSTEAQEEFDWGLERFLAEARTLAKFDHRNIVKVYRSFSANGTGYIVMEYAEGDTFSEYLERKGSLSEQELKNILIPILRGLGKIHAEDFLHRDIKPLNIIIRDSDESAVLIDFGSARQAIGAKDQHLTALVSGGYAPIEQYSSRGNQGPWTDIYALGALCYRALSGEDPYAATDRIKNDPLVPISKKCKGKASPEFLKAIDWALAVNEDDRPQNVDQWIAALEGKSQEVEPDPVLPPGEDETVLIRPAPDERNRTALYAGVATLVVVVTGGGWFFTRQPGEVDITDSNELALQQSRDRYTEISEQIEAGTLTAAAYEPELVLVRQGNFRMGDTVGDGDSDELPVRQVTIADDFSISKYEIAYTDYAYFAESTGRNIPDSAGYDVATLPAINISWQDATSYASWLSELSGKTYRLPSEAEWEYAARAGAETNYPWGNDLEMDKANCRTCKSDNSRGGPQASGSFEPNPDELHDVYGNVWEWVQDCAHDGYLGAPRDGSAWETDTSCSRVLRGGAWDSDEFQLRSSYRNWRPAGDRTPTIGFRLIREE